MKGDPVFYRTGQRKREMLGWLVAVSPCGRAVKIKKRRLHSWIPMTDVEKITKAVDHTFEFDI
jgi:hypothetical protein